METPPHAAEYMSMPLDTETTLLRGAWRVDRSCSTVGFLIRHMGVATVRGTFSSFDARIEDGSVRGQVDVASVDTGDAIRDGRLRAEFFAAADFPSITFEALLGTAQRIHGPLTIRGVTRPVTLTVRAEPLDGGSLRLRAEGRIRRSDFGLEWEALRQAGRLLVADHVRLFADVVVRRACWPPTKNVSAGTCRNRTTVTSRRSTAPGG